MVMVSNPGANSWSPLRICSRVISSARMRRHPTEAGGQAAFHAPPDFVVGSVILDSVDQVYPLLNVRIRFGVGRKNAKTRSSGDEVVTFVDAALGWYVPSG